jgi:hypothetical protein
LYGLLNHCREGKTLLSGTGEPESCSSRPVILPAADVAASGPDVATPASDVMTTSADDAPHVQATKYVTRANIQTTVNGVAGAGCRATSIVMR